MSGVSKRSNHSPHWNGDAESVALQTKQSIASANLCIVKAIIKIAWIRLGSEKKLFHFQMKYVLPDLVAKSKSAAVLSKQICPIFIMIGRRTRIGNESIGGRSARIWA